MTLQHVLAAQAPMLSDLDAKENGLCNIVSGGGGLRAAAEQEWRHQSCRR